MNSNLAKKSDDSVNNILSSIKAIIEENNENHNALLNNKTGQTFSVNYALQGYQSQSDYLLNNHPNFKNRSENSYKGVETLTVEDAIDNLTRQIGIQSTNSIDSARDEVNLDSILNDFNSPKENSDLTYNKINTEKMSNNNFVTEDLILKSAMEEANNRLRVIISKWFQNNLPTLIKQIIHEEMTKVLKNIKF